MPNGDHNSWIDLNADQWPIPAQLCKLHSGFLLHVLLRSKREALLPNQGSYSAHSYYTDQVLLSDSAQVHWTYTPANCNVFSVLHWIFQAVYVQCCTAGTLKLHWTRTPLRWGYTNGIDWGSPELSSLMTTDLSWNRIRFNMNRLKV